MKLTENLIAVEVPMDANDICAGSLGLALYFEHDNKTKHRNLGFGKVEILGEVTKDEIKVDYSKFPDVCLTGVEASMLLDHNDRIDLRKLFQSKGLYFENPIIEPCHLNYKHKNQYNELVWISESHKSKYCYIYDEWQEAESKLIKGKLIILKKL